MILSFQPTDQTERRMVEAQIRINHPLPTTIILKDGEILDLST